MASPLFRKIDCIMLKADDLDAATRFYCGLGHAVIWKTEEAVAFHLPETDTEFVVHKRIGPETDLLVEDADVAHQILVKAGARSVMAPFDIPIGRCAVVEDPFGNRLVVLDQSNGEFVTDEHRNVVGVAPKAHP